MLVRHAHHRLGLTGKILSGLKKLKRGRKNDLPRITRLIRPSPARNGGGARSPSSPLAAARSKPTGGSAMASGCALGTIPTKKFERNGKRYIAQLTETSSALCACFMGMMTPLTAGIRHLVAPNSGRTDATSFGQRRVKMDNRKTIREQRDESQWGFWLVILAVDLGLAYLWMYG